MLKDTLTPCHSSHLGRCSAFQDGDETLLGGVGLVPGLFLCQVVLRGRMDALGAMVALTWRSSRKLGRGAGLILSWLHGRLPCIQIPGEHGRLFQDCCVEIHFRKALETHGTVARAPLLLWGWCFDDHLGEQNT